MKKGLDEWSAGMDVLGAKAQEAREGAKERYQEQLSALHTRRLEGDEKLDAIKAATEDSWAQLTAGTENVWVAFEDPVDAFKAHFK